MAKIVLSLDNIVVREVLLDKDHLSLGRKPYNHIVIDNMAVSGNHAIFQYVDGSFFIEDLNSSNGTSVNGIKITRQQLQHGDVIGIAKFRIQFHAPPEEAFAPPKVTGVLDSTVKVISGSLAGHVVRLNKELTTLGEPGVVLACIARRGEKFVLCSVEASRPLNCNGKVIAEREHILVDGDLIDLGPVQLVFSQHTNH